MPRKPVQKHTSEDESMSTELRRLDPDVLKLYKFSMGNSTDGPIGFVVDIVAGSETEALAYLQEAIDGWPCIERAEYYSLDDEEKGIRYFDIYFNSSAVSVSDIEEWDFEEEDLEDEDPEDEDVEDEEDF
jgi:hypothetical protein